MESEIRNGRAWRFGDNINTDIISPPQYMELSIEEAARYSMQTVDPSFAATVKPSDILVAGKNFGSGSSRETAPLTLKQLGVTVIIAEFFARIFYRNAINVGLIAVECADADQIRQGDELSVNLAQGCIYDETQNKKYECSRLPPHIMRLVEDGGLVRHLELQYKEPER